MSFRHHYHPFTTYRMLHGTRARRKIEEGNFTGPPKRDQKLYKGKVSGWQEYYMGRFTEDYVAYLNSNKPVLAKFWTMEKHMRQDKKTPGAYMEPSRGNMMFDLAHFLQDEVIVFDNLDESPERLKENVKLSRERFG